MLRLGNLTYLLDKINKIFITRHTTKEVHFMSDMNKEDKPMTANTLEKILKQNHETMKAIKENSESNYAQMYKKMLKNKKNQTNKK